jgi:hypothetical protein
MRIGCLVFGLTPLRAFLSATLKVPNPTNCTILSFFTPTLTELMTAVTARSASALLVSPPSCFWTAATNSTLFMINDALVVGSWAGNLVSKPGRALTLLILSFSQHSLLFVNVLILFLWILIKRELSVSVLSCQKEAIFPRASEWFEFNSDFCFLPRKSE